MAFQLSVGLIATAVALFAGVTSVGAVGAETMVVKLDVEEYELVPPALAAFTRQ